MIIPMLCVTIFVILVVWFLLPRVARSEERFSRNAETDLVCRLLLEKKKKHPITSITLYVVYFQLLISFFFTLLSSFFFFFFFNDTATTEIYTLSLHDALPILVYRF